MAVYVNEGNSFAKTNSVVDMTVGGDGGAKRDTVNWSQNNLHVKPKLITVLLSAPTGFDFLPDAAYRRAFLKSLVERYPISVTGINISITVETEQVAAGNDEQFEAPVGVIRERSVPVMSVPERKGKPIKKFLDDWIRLLILDPKSRHPGVVGTEEYIAAGSPPIDPEFYTCSFLFIEPTDNLTGYTDAVLFANAFPKGYVEELSKVAGENNEIITREIEWAGMQQVEGIDDIVQPYIDSLNKEGFSAIALKPMVSGIQADVADDAAANGYRKGLADFVSAGE